MSLVQQLHNRRKSFHAAIARRASLVVQKPDPTYFIPNTPFPLPKPPPVRPTPVRNIEPDYWHLMWFHDLVFGRRQSEPRPIRVEDVLRAVAQEFCVSKLDLLSHRRTKEIVLPRQVAAYLAKKLTERTLPEIGRRIGGRDHSTIHFAVRKVESLLTKDEALKERVHRVARSLGGAIA